jgi:hypothetical protein
MASTMFWIVVFVVTVGGAAARLALGDGGVTVERAGRLGLLWFGAVFYGAATLLSGLQHLLVPDRIADSIGWPRGSGFQRELGWAEAGIGVAIGHARDMATQGNRHPGNAGPVLYVDILAPAVTVLAIVLAHPWRPAA